MTQNKRGHWRVYIVKPNPTSLPDADPNGKHSGIQFADGFAYVNWKVLGETATYDAITKLGSDSRFQVVEIPEQHAAEGSK